MFFDTFQSARCELTFQRNLLPPTPLPEYTTLQPSGIVPFITLYKMFLCSDVYSLTEACVLDMENCIYKNVCSATCGNNLSYIEF